MEFGVFLADERAGAVKRILQTWQQQAPWRLLPQPILQVPAVDEVTPWQQAQLQKEKMSSTKEVQLGELIADSADQLDLPKPVDKNRTVEKALAYELRYQWQVSAPRLNGKAKEIKQQLEKKEVSYVPPVYQQNGRNVVAIQQPQEISAAQNLIQQGIAKAIVVRD